VDEYIRPQPGNRVVDIGCGPGTMLPYLGPVDYIGFDLNAAYIEHAKQTYSGQGTFFQGRVDEAADQLELGIDIVIAIAVLHHLSDQETRALFAAANRILRPGGRLITFDNVFTSPQNPIARLLIRLDRGKSVRTAGGYLSLAKEGFGEVEVDIRSDLLRIPYTHCIMVCHK
jgi:SAM-dependent methyltransferase